MNQLLLPLLSLCPHSNNHTFLSSFRTKAHSWVFERPTIQLGVNILTQCETSKLFRVSTQGLFREFSISIQGNTEKQIVLRETSWLWWKNYLRIWGNHFSVQILWKMSVPISQAEHVFWYLNSRYFEQRDFDLLVEKKQCKTETSYSYLRYFGGVNRGLRG